MKAIYRVEKVFSFFGHVSRVLGTMLLLMIAGHFLLGLVNVIHDAYRGQGYSNGKEFFPVYDNYPDYHGGFWKEHYEAEVNMRFEPYYHWRGNGFRGKYINISDDGIRRTVTLKNNKDAKKVFMFGGSTIWGFDNKDEHTIPSLLQLMLGEDYKVYNYGEIAYVSTQELNLLLHQLAKGNIPDAVIFYDGVNDGYAGVYSPAIPGDVQDLRAGNKEDSNALINLYHASNYEKLIRFVFKDARARKWGNKVSSDIKANSPLVIELYEAHIRQVKALGKEYGFKTFFFWQPNLFSGTREVFPYEEQIIRDSLPVFVESQRQVYLDAKSAFSDRENERIFFLGDIFNHAKEPIYTDWCHIGPNGNEIVARHIFDNIIK